MIYYLLVLLNGVFQPGGAFPTLQACQAYVAMQEPAEPVTMKCESQEDLSKNYYVRYDRGKYYVLKSDTEHSWQIQKSGLPKEVQTLMSGAIKGSNLWADIVNLANNECKSQVGDAVICSRESGKFLTVCTENPIRID